MNNRILVYLT